MPDGVKMGAPGAEVCLTIKDRSVLAHLAAGQVGLLGEDYVEGKFDVEGSMRDLMRLAATILPGSPIEAARVLPSKPKPGHTLPSWATFSAGVIAVSRASTRSSPAR